MTATVNEQVVVSPVPAEGARGRLVIAGRYVIELDHPLGAGGMALVYAGQDLKLRRNVALKTLRLEYRNDPDSRARFRQEMRRMDVVDHPNVARVYDLHEEADAPWAVMEFVPGVSLKDLIADRGAIPPPEVADLLDQIAAALGAVHARQLVHLDVKPQNLLVTPDGQVKLIDFGLAQPPGARQELIGGATFGTAAYLAPEQAGGEPVDASTDVYALGCVVYEMLTGRPPFVANGTSAIKHDVIRAHIERDPEPPSKLRPDLGLTPGLDDVVLWALAKRPRDRYRDAASFANVFRSALDNAGLASIVTTAPLGLVDVPWGATPEPPIPNGRRAPVTNGRPAVALPLPPRSGSNVATRVVRRPWRFAGLCWRLTRLTALANVFLALALLIDQGTTGLLGGEPRLHAGGDAQVVIDDLTVRDAPGLDSTPLMLVDSGREVHLRGGAAFVDGMLWWPVTVERDGADIDGYVWSDGIAPRPDRPDWLEAGLERVEGVWQLIQDAAAPLLP